MAPGTAAPDSGLPDGRFLDREESWLRFNQRVLELAEDPSTPLLERVRFLSIFASNLDEFFMVRVAGRIRRMATGLPVEGASGLSPEQILTNTLETARELSLRHAECFRELVAARAGRARHRDPALEGAVRRRAGGPAPAVPGADLPGADPAAGRPGAPVPLHLRPVAEPGGDDRRRPDRGDHVRPGQGAAAAAQVPHRSGSAGSSRSRTSSPPTSPSCSRAWTSSSTTCSGSPAPGTSRWTRTSPRT